MQQTDKTNTSRQNTAVTQIMYEASL